MIKLIKGAAVAAVVGGLMFAPNALAEPSDACDAGIAEDSSGATQGVVTGEQNDTSTGGSLSVCIDGTGNVTAQGDATTGGSVVADGDSTNEEPLYGFIGAEVNSESPDAVGSACNEDYEAGADDDSIDPVGIVESGGTSDCG